MMNVKQPIIKATMSIPINQSFQNFKENQANLEAKQENKKLYLTKINREGGIEQKRGVGWLIATVKHTFYRVIDYAGSTDLIGKWERQQWNELFQKNIDNFIQSFNPQEELTPLIKELKAFKQEDLSNRGDATNVSKDIPVSQQKMVKNVDLVIGRILSRLNINIDETILTLNDTIKKAQKEKNIDLQKLSEILSPDHKIPANDTERLDEMKMILHCAEIKLKINQLFNKLQEKYGKSYQQQNQADPIHQKLKEEHRQLLDFLGDVELKSMQQASDVYLARLKESGYIDQHWQQGKGDERISPEEREIVGKIISLDYAANEEVTLTLKHVSADLAKNIFDTKVLETVADRHYSPLNENDPQTRLNNLKLIEACITIKSLEDNKKSLLKEKTLAESQNMIDYYKIDLIIDISKTYKDRMIGAPQQKSLTPEEKDIVDRINQNYVINHPQEFPPAFVKLQTLLKEANIRTSSFQLLQKLNDPDLDQTKKLKIALKFSNWQEIETLLTEIKKWHLDTGKNVLQYTLDLQSLSHMIEECKTFPNQFMEMHRKFVKENGSVAVEGEEIVPTNDQLKAAFQLSLPMFEEISMNTNGKNALMARITQVILCGEEVGTIPYPTDGACFTFQEIRGLCEDIPIQNAGTPWHWDIDATAKASQPPEEQQIPLTREQNRAGVEGKITTAFNDYMRGTIITIKDIPYEISQSTGMQQYLLQLRLDYADYLQKNPKAINETLEFDRDFCQTLGLSLTDDKLSQGNFNAFIAKASNKAGVSNNNARLGEAYKELFGDYSQLEDDQIQSIMNATSDRWHSIPEARVELDFLLRVHLIKMLLMTSQSTLGGVRADAIHANLNEHLLPRRFLSIVNKGDQIPDVLIHPLVVSDGTERSIVVEPDSIKLSVTEGWSFNFSAMDKEPIQTLIGSQDVGNLSGISVVKARRNYTLPQLGTIDEQKPHSVLTNFKEIKVSPYMLPFLDELPKAFGTLS